MNRKQLILTNTFGTFGYLSCLLLWAWVILLYLPLVFNNDQIMTLLLPSGENALPTHEPLAPSPILTIIASIVTVVVLIMTAIVILRTPVTVAKTGRKVTTKAAVSVEPLIVRGRHLPPQEKKRLTASLVKLIKLLLVIAPVVGAWISAIFPIELSFQIVMVVSGTLALVSIFWFGLQYMTAAALHVPTDKLV